MTPYDHWKTTDRLAEAPDPLEGKPRGFCPWCDSALEKRRLAANLHCIGYAWKSHCHYDAFLTEDQNRIRYAAQRLEESKLWNKIEKEGGER